MIATILNQREAQWSEEQKVVSLENRRKDEKSHQSKPEIAVSVQGMERTSKQHRGVEYSILSQKPDVADEIVKTELTYYMNIHKAEVIASPSLFKLNKVIHKERLINLCVVRGRGRRTRYYIMMTFL